METSQTKHSSYARASINGERVYMHRFLFPEAEEIDHINHDGRDNRRENLRPGTDQQNMMHQKAQGRRWKGVSRRTSTCWRAAIKVYDSWMHIGNFPSPEAAARAYDEFAFVAFGDWAELNFPDQINEYRWRARISCYYPDGTPVVPDV